MLEYHAEKQADATIAVIEVSWAEAGRFGILHTNDKMEITSFEEKPKYPKSNLASMGVYVLNGACLKMRWNAMKKFRVKPRFRKRCHSGSSRRK